jgi:ankyrin repeat protein
MQVSLTKEDRWGHTPLSEAERFGHTSVARLLRQYLEAAVGRDTSRPENRPPDKMMDDIMPKDWLIDARRTYCTVSVVFSNTIKF